MQSVLIIRVHCEIIGMMGKVDSSDVSLKKFLYDIQYELK